MLQSKAVFYIIINNSLHKDKNNLCYKSFILCNVLFIKKNFHLGSREGIRLSDNQLLEVQNLHTGFRLKDDYYDAVDDVSFTLDKTRF